MAAAVLPGEYETPAAMIAAIQAHRAAQAAREAAEARQAEEVARRDPAVRAWLEAARIEQAEAN